MQNPSCGVCNHDYGGKLRAKLSFLSNVKPQKEENLFLNDKNEWMMGD